MKKLKVLKSTYNKLINKKMMTLLLELPKELILQTDLFNRNDLNVYKIVSDNNIVRYILSSTEWGNILSFYINKKESNHPEISELILDIQKIYNELSFEEKEYHIPFEKEIIDMEFLGEADMDGIYGYIKFNHSEEEFNNKETYEKLMNEYVILISASICVNLDFDGIKVKDHVNTYIKNIKKLINNNEIDIFNHISKVMNAFELVFFKRTFLSNNEDISNNPPYYEKSIIVVDNNYKFTIDEYGVCENYKGFISKKYLIENS